MSAQNWQACLVAMGIAVSLFVIVLVWCQTGRRRDQSIFLSLFLGLYVLSSLGEIFLLTGGYLSAPHLAAAHLPVKMLMGPATYYYVRAMTTPSPLSPSWRDTFVLTGPGLVLLIMIPFYGLSAAEKLALADPATRDPSLFALALLSCAAAFALYLIFNYGYLIAAALRHKHHRQRLRDMYANIEHRSLDWLPLMLFVLAFSLFWQAISGLWGLTGSRPTPVSLSSAFADFAFMSAFALLSALQQQTYDQEDATEPQPTLRYAKSSLSEERMERIAAKLLNAMTSERLFENPSLSLRAIADHLGVSENHLSETFSRQLKTSFFDFVNSHRIEAAARRLAETDDTALEIAYDAGFNSRSTFNTAFKKHKGVTPSDYRRETGAVTSVRSGPSI